MPDTTNLDEKAEGRSFLTEDSDPSGYVGVNHEYATYGVDTEKPLASDDEQKLAEAQQKKKVVGPSANPGVEGAKKREAVKAKDPRTHEVGEQRSPLPPPQTPHPGDPKEGADEEEQGTKEQPPKPPTTSGS